MQNHFTENVSKLDPEKVLFLFSLKGFYEYEYLCSTLPTACVQKVLMVIWEKTKQEGMLYLQTKRINKKLSELFVTFIEKELKEKKTFFSYKEEIYYWSKVQD